MLCRVHREREIPKDTKVTEYALMHAIDLAENDQDFKVMLRKIKDRYDSNHKWPSFKAGA